MSNTTIILNWPANPASEGVNKYQVLQSVDNNPFLVIGETHSNDFQIQDPAPGFYKWRVQAVNFVGIGQQSDPAEGPTVPSKVGTVTVTIVSTP